MEMFVGSKQALLMCTECARSLHIVPCYWVFLGSADGLDDIA